MFEIINVFYRKTCVIETTNICISFQANVPAIVAAILYFNGSEKTTNYYFKWNSCLSLQQFYVQQFKDHFES